MSPVICTTFGASTGAGLATLTTFGMVVVGGIVVVDDVVAGASLFLDSSKTVGLRDKTSSFDALLLLGCADNMTQKSITIKNTTKNIQIFFRNVLWSSLNRCNMLTIFPLQLIKTQPLILAIKGFFVFKMFTMHGDILQSSHSRMAFLQQKHVLNLASRCNLLYSRTITTNT